MFKCSFYVDFWSTNKSYDLVDQHMLILIFKFIFRFIFILPIAMSVSVAVD